MFDSPAENGESTDNPFTSLQGDRSGESEFAAFEGQQRLAFVRGCLRVRPSAFSLPLTERWVMIPPGRGDFVDEGQVISLSAINVNLEYPSGFDRRRNRICQYHALVDVLVQPGCMFVCNGLNDMEFVMRSHPIEMDDHER